jgi:molybdopterin-guanine dinucleotide biosynthesis protein A
MNKKRSLVNGLVLAGGKSSRMGFDKSSVQWHGKQQQYYLADLLSLICEDVYISKRKAQELAGYDGYKVLPDSYTGIGPYGAILSALAFLPDVAWLVVACDLPFMDTATLKYLLQNRDEAAIATTFESPYDQLPEPLITIWEPRSFPILLDHLEKGFSCPRKVLIKSERVHTIQPPDPDALMNVNTPGEFLNAETKLGLQKARSANG